MTQPEIKARLSNKTSVLSSFYSYSYLGSNPLQCIFLDLNSEDDEESDEKGKILEDDLITFFGRDDFSHFNQISHFIPFEIGEQLHKNIRAHWRAKAKAYITELLQTSIDNGQDYIFTFVPKSI